MIAIRGSFSGVRWRTYASLVGTLSDNSAVCSSSKPFNKNGLMLSTAIATISSLVEADILLVAKKPTPDSTTIRLKGSPLASVARTVEDVLITLLIDPVKTVSVTLTISF